ncbi:hypothetical protein N0V94_005473 [Neodidymelliopsis sp. IMI 364377]|nr:hypothetical protein N0V94_005473 [Neodidymelliopsis sp. IMI 364377]
MRFSEVLAASLVAPLVAAHGGIQGAPKLFGLPNDIKIRNPTPRAARAAAAAQGPYHLIARQGGNAEGRCGPAGGGASCAEGYCCSAETPAGASTRDDARPQLGSVQYGGAGIYSCLKPGTVAITYDDGPYIYTDEVLNKFNAAGFKATFFVTGINIGKGAIDEQWRAVIQRMVAEGHQVASHTWSHQDLSAITEAQVYDQMVKNEMAIRNIIGKYPTYMRPPYSSCNGVCQNVLQKLGYVVSYFDLDTDDYNQLTREKIEVAKNNFRNAVNAANPATGSKLAIGHDIHELTALNLTVTMIETLQARGFKGVTMGECMNEPEANWYRSSTPGTSPSSSTRVSSTAGPTSTPTGAVSTDGSCGGTNGYKCSGSSFGNCCSQYGWCGASTDHCGTGCNSLFGNCGTNANPSSAPASSTTLSSAPQPTGALKTSTDGSCGASSGFTCTGFTLDGAKAECCSQYGFCGATADYCGTGCNPLAGNCGSVSSSVSSSVALSTSAPVASDKHDSTSSSAAITPSVSSSTVHSSSATPSVSTDKSGDKSSTASSIHPDITSSASDKHESSTVSSVQSDVTSSASDKHESKISSSIYLSDSSSASSVYPSGSSSTSEKPYSSATPSDYVPTKPSQTSSVYADDYSTAASSSSEYSVASSTAKYPASSATPNYATTLASSVRPASSTPSTTLPTATPTPTKSVSQDGKCGGELGQTCAGYKSSFGLKLECCCKQTGRCSADPWACGFGCDKKNGKCWF